MLTVVAVKPVARRYHTEFHLAVDYVFFFCSQVPVVLYSTFVVLVRLMPVPGTKEASLMSEYCSGDWHMGVQ